MQRVVSMNVNPAVETTRFKYLNGEEKMHQPGDMIIYGSTGVCRVKEITTPDFEKNEVEAYIATRVNGKRD